MKKLFVGLILIMIGVYCYQAKEELIIPEEAIRFRVIAEDDSLAAQSLKQLVSTNLQKQITQELKGIYNIEEARQVLKENIPTYRATVLETLKENNSNTTFQIHYGKNPFPEKVYKGVTYKEGEYESLVVTLGKGLGKNWWCVLFPPICLLEAEEETTTDKVEYKFFIQELLDKYF